MASPVKLYQKEMHTNVGFFATWLPGDSIQLGDVGVMQAGRFRKAGTLADLDIEYGLGPAGEPQPLRFTSSSGTKVASSVGAAAAMGAIGAEIQVDFSSEGAFLFDAVNVRQLQIAGRLAVTQQILERYEEERWKKEWYVVESLYEAHSATVIVAQDGTAGVTLAAKADMPVAVGALADPKLGLHVTKSHGRTVQVIAGQGIHPLYSCLRLKDSLFSRPDVVPVRGRGGASMEQFARPAIDELLGS